MKTIQLETFTTDVVIQERTYTNESLTRIYTALVNHGIVTECTLDEVLANEDRAQEMVTAWYCELTDASSMEALNAIKAKAEALKYFTVSCQWDWLAEEFEC